MRVECSFVLNFRGGGGLIRSGGQHKILKVGGSVVTVKWPLGQAIILLVKWVGGNWGEGACSNFEYKTGRSLGKNNFLWTFFFFCIYRCEGVFMVKMERYYTFNYLPYTL